MKKCHWSVFNKFFVFVAFLICICICICNFWVTDFTNLKEIFVTWLTMQAVRKVDNLRDEKMSLEGIFSAGAKEVIKDPERSDVNIWVCTPAWCTHIFTKMQYKSLKWLNTDITKYSAYNMQLWTYEFERWPSAHMYFFSHKYITTTYLVSLTRDAKCQILYTEKILRNKSYCHILTPGCQLEYWRP